MSASDHSLAPNIQIWEDAHPMGLLSNEGVLITGVYGSGKSSVAVEIAYLLEQRRQPYALLDLDYQGWSFDCSDDDGLDLMLRNVAAVVSNYRTAGISVFAVAKFVSDRDVLLGIQEAIRVSLRDPRFAIADHGRSQADNSRRVTERSVPVVGVRAGGSER